MLPACRVLSVLYYGEYDEGVDEAWLTLGREVKERGLTPAGLPRVLGIVAPYTGRGDRSTALLFADCPARE